MSKLIYWLNNFRCIFMSHRKCFAVQYNWSLCNGDCGDILLTTGIVILHPACPGFSCVYLAASRLFTVSNRVTPASRWSLRADRSGCLTVDSPHPPVWFGLQMWVKKYLQVIFTFLIFSATSCFVALDLTFQIKVPSTFKKKDKTCNYCVAQGSVNCAT